MRIEIQVEPSGGPSGEVSVDGDRARPFASWLQLLAILGELLPLPGADGPREDGDRLR